MDPEEDTPQDNSVENLLGHSITLHQESARNHEQLLEHTLQTVDEHGRMAEQLLEHNLAISGEVLKKVHEKKSYDTEEADDGSLKIKIHKPKKGVDYFTDQEVQGIVREAAAMIRIPDDGHTPEKGVDYFTQEEILHIIQRVKDSLPEVEDGHTPEKGVDYFTPSDIEEIIQKTIDRIPPAEDGDDGDDAPPVDEEALVKKILAKLPERDMLKEITVDFLLSKLKGKIQFGDIEGAPQFKMGGTGYLREITDVEVLTEPADGYLVGWSSIKKKWVPVAPSTSTGSGLTRLLSTETPDGSNTVFTFPSKPTYILNGGLWYQENDGWTWNAGASQATMGVPPPSSTLKLLGFV